MSKIKLAFLGCGDVAQRDYLPEFHRLANRAEIVAICGRTEARVRVVAERYGIKAWYTDYERMLSETEAEAVVNLTPIQLHLETSLASLQAGKHVYSEKPVASTMPDVDRLRAEAQSRNLKLVCAPCVMLFPQVKYAQSRLAEGALGDVYSARGQGHFGVPPWPGFMSDPSPFFAKGAGPAMDMGVYPLHALTGLLGPARRVTAMTAQVLSAFTIEEGPFAGQVIPVEVEDNWHMILDFGHGRLVSVTAQGCIRETKAPHVELHGLQGSLALDVVDVSAPVELYRPGSGWQSIPVPQSGRQAGPDHHLGVEHLVDCIQHQREPLLSVEHARHVIEIIEKAALSSQQGRALELETTF
jgi:predicted dehydrogenase